MQAINANDAAADLVHRDKRIPGLGLMLDPSRLLSELSGELDCRQVENIELAYLRYKPGMNCLAGYKLLVADQTIHAYAKAHGEDAGEKVGKSMQRTVIDGVLGPGRVVLKKPQIIFSVFPNDAKLAGLQCLNDAGFRRRLFRRLFDQGSTWQESSLGQVLNYKPERRYVARLTDPNGKPALVKFYSRSGYTKARTISRRLGDKGEGFYPETIGRSKKHAAIAYHWQPGITLRQLNIDGKLALSDLAATAEALAEFHASRRGGLIPLEPGAQLERLNALAEQVGVLLPELHQRATRVAQLLAEWLNRQASVSLPVHGDFYDKQAIICDGKARLIDLDAARLDNPLLDLGSYIAHLERQVGSRVMAATELETQKHTLISSYMLAAGSVDTGQINKYIALGLFDLIHQPFRDWTQDWPAQTEQMLCRVESLFAA